MKKSLLIFALGLLLGALGWRYYQRTYQPTVSQRAGELAKETKQHAAASAKELGEDMSDASIVARIKGKYLVERDLPALAISVECNHGRVILTGSTDSEAGITRAVALARETKGVTDVTSRLTVRQ